MNQRRYQLSKMKSVGLMLFAVLSILSSFYSGPAGTKAQPRAKTEWVVRNECREQAAPRRVLQTNKKALAFPTEASFINANLIFNRALDHKIKRANSNWIIITPSLHNFLHNDRNDLPGDATSSRC